MNPIVTRAIVMTCLWLGFCAAARAEEPFPIPDGYGLVNDYHRFLTVRQSRALHEKLYALEKKNGTQIVLLIVPTTGDVPIRDYAHQVFAKWNIGNNWDGNGVLFLISGSQGRVYIATGPGIGGALPDIKVQHIYDEHLDPHFRKQEFIEGINETVDALVAATHPEETAGAKQPTFAIRVTLDAIIATLLGLVGVAYIAFFGWRWHRQRKNSKVVQNA